MRRIVLFVLMPCLSAATAHAAEKETSFRGKTFKEWKCLLNSPDTRTRCRAVTALGLGPFGKAAVPHLLRALDDPQRTVCEAAKAALENLGPDAAEAVPALIAEVCSKDATVRVLTYLQMAQIRGAVAAILEEESRQTETSPHFRHFILRGMGPADVPHLLAALRDGSNVKNRRFAAEALAHLRTRAPEALPVLIRALDDEDEEVRDSVLWALQRVGPRAAACRPRPTAPAWAGQPPPGVLSVLGALGPTAYPVLTQVYRRGDVDTRTAVIESLSDAGPGALPLLRAALDDPAATVRSAALLVLGTARLDVSPLLGRLLADFRTANAEDRASILFVLGCVQPPRREALEVIGRALGDPQDKVGETAARVLQQLNRTAAGAIPQLLEALTDFRPEVRLRAAMTLGCVVPADRGVVLGLCRTLKDEDPDVRRQAAKVLGSFGRETLHLQRSPDRGEGMEWGIVGEALRARLFDSDSGVRVSAAHALWQLGLAGEEVVRVLGLEALAPWRWLWLPVDSDARQAAIRLLGEMGPAAVPYLTLTLWDTNVRSGVAEALAAVGPAGREALLVLGRLYLADGVLDVPTTTALARMGEAAVPIFREALAGDKVPATWSVVYAASQDVAIAREFVPTLIEMLGQENTNHRVLAVAALGRCDGKDERVRAALKRALADPEREVRQGALEAVAALGTGAHPINLAVCDALLDSSPALRVQALRTLGRIGPDAKVGIPALLESLTDPDPDVRVAAAEVLGGVREADRPVRDALHAACRDRDGRVCLSAARALGRQGASKAVAEVFERVLQRGKGAERVEAARALWELDRRPCVVPALARLLQEEDGPTRSAARDVLRELRRQSADVKAFLRPLLRHAEEQVREAAATALGDLPPRLPPVNVGRSSGW
jgi:HEAT repeat protein